MSSMIQIMDDTLREGMQTPYVMFTKDEKITIAKRLFEAGIKRLWFPILLPM